MVIHLLCKIKLNIYDSVSKYCFLQTLFCMTPNGYVYGIVWRFEARTCQTATKFIRCNILQISTIRQMHYTRCWQLVFIHIHLYFIYLALFSCHCQPAPTYPRSTNLFCFFERGQTLMPCGQIGSALQAL